MTGYTKSIYLVHEKVKYVELKSGRHDVGEFHVETAYYHSDKELLLLLANCCKEFIEKNVFEDEKEANEAALRWTIDKLTAINEPKGANE